MKASILHTPDGQIIAITVEERSRAPAGQFSRAAMLPKPGQHLLHVELSEEQAQKSLLNLHKEYQVDVAAGRLTRKPELE